MNTLRRLFLAIVASLSLVSCTGGSAIITGTLVGSDGHCLYVDGANGNGSDLYWLRQVPPGYALSEDEHVGFIKPDGNVISIGDSVTVTGTLSWVPFERQCAGSHTLDATAIN